MRIMKLGKTDLSVSAVCLGTANFGEKLERETAFRLLDAFIGGGGSFIDTANVYCRWVPGLDNIGERFIGQWLKSRNAYDKVIVATKGGHYDFNSPTISRVTKEQISLDIEDSLRTLDLSRIDFYWLHRDNTDLPIGEIIDIMDGFVKAGKIRYYGASNYSQARMTQAVEYAANSGVTGFSAVSNQWSLASPNPGSNPNPDPTLVQMDDNYYDWHRRTRLPMVPYSSTAQGFFGKLFNASARVEGGNLSAPLPTAALPEATQKAFINERNLRIYVYLSEMSREYSASMHALSVAALAGAPFPVIPVAAVSSEKQLADLLAAGNLELRENLFEQFGVAGQHYGQEEK